MQFRNGGISSLFENWELEIENSRIMASPYQEFVEKAKARYEANKLKKLQPKGGIEFTAHARYKMSQYGLSEQKVKGVIRSPRRTETGIAPRTVAVMQPVSPKIILGKEVWKQEIWVMYQLCKSKADSKAKIPMSNQNSTFKIQNSTQRNMRIISAWRYPGVSPKRSPIPQEILQELVSGDILEMFDKEGEK